MFNDVSDMINQMKEKTMEAMLPMELPISMKEKFLKLSHKMSPAEITEVGKKFQEHRKKAFEEFKEKQKEKEQKKELLAQRMCSRN